MPVNDYAKVSDERSREALGEANPTLERFLEDSAAAIVCVNCSGNVTLWNASAERMFGWKAEEVLGKPVPCIPENLQGLYRNARAAVFEGGSSSGLEAEAVTKDGSLVPISVSSTPLRNERGEVRAAVDIILDISGRRQTESQMRLQAAALESTANAVVITDRQGKAIWVNPGFTTITGYLAEEVLGRNLRILNSGKHPRTFFEDLWKAILSGSVWHGEIVNRRKDGRLYTEDQTITPVRDADGRIAHFIAIKQDITEKKLLTQQLNQAQRMESVGLLAGGVAHDFNNLLSVIIGYSDLLLESAGSDDKARKKVEEIRNAGRRAASLTRQLLAFSRQQILEPKVLNINSAVAEMEKMLKRLIGADVELHTSLDEALGSVKADPGQIEQIIMNLAVNARDAMPQGGKLIIETGNFEADEEYALCHPPMSSGRYVSLSVADNGTGMDAETKARIFEPFFTTKELGKGTGLGLSTVYGVVKQSKGWIWVYSEPGQGTTFKIYLPRVDQSATSVVQKDAAAPIPLGKETVLLVEDEPSLRALTREVLEHGGYSVLEAVDGVQALDIAKKFRGAIHLLLSDVVMPKMNGPALAGNLAPFHPEARVLYMSGYSGNFANLSGLLDSEVALVQKPFSREAMLRKLREVLDLQEKP